MKAIEFLKQNRVCEDETIYNSVGEIVGTVSQLMEEYAALRQSSVMPSLPDGLDDDSNCDHNFKLGWIACWKALTGNVESCKHEYSHYTNEYNETVAVCEKCLDAYF